MNIHLDVAILVSGDLNPYLNEKKQCADEIFRKTNPTYLKPPILATPSLRI
jgi:hypothetical protein